MTGITSLTLSAEVEEKLAVLGLVADSLGLDDTTPSRCVSAVSRLLTEAPLPRVCILMLCPLFSYMTALVELSESLLMLGTVNARLAMTEDELRDALAQVQHSRKLIER